MWATRGWGSAEAPDQTLAAVPTTPLSPRRPHSNVPNPKRGPKRDPLQADAPTPTEVPHTLETEGLPTVSPARTEGPAERHEAEAAHPEAGVEVDVVGLAHLLVTFVRTVQGSDADGGGPV